MKAKKYLVLFTGGVSGTSKGSSSYGESSVVENQIFKNVIYSLEIKLYSMDVRNVTQK